MTVDRTMDHALIEKIVKHPRVWQHIWPGTVPPAESISVHPGEAIRCLIVKDDGDPIGIVAFDGEEVHACFLPHGWGKSLEGLKLAFVWFWEHTALCRITASIPMRNRLAVQLAKRAGMRWLGLEDGLERFELCR
jgi:RimJ/RimL family protein N-acetyltransferase